MNLLQIKVGKHCIFGFVFFLLFQTIHAQNGETLFKQNCASCHSITKDLTGPALAGMMERGPWAENKKNLYDWIHNPQAFMAKDPYTQALKQKYGTVMTAFPQLKDTDIDAIIEYVNTPIATPGPGTTPDGIGEGGEDKSNRNAIIFGVISLILAIIALILMQVNSNLKKLSDDKENIHRPEPVPVYRNKVYIALLAILFFVVGGYFVGKGAIGLGRQQGYAPTQPIYYSHKVHAGINQINCLYCHGGAWDSKHALIPSVNVCMNC
ncbi:MAG: c-type cytochrome, partial [Flavitalea sp.]